jgi:hypothetical protein
MRTVGAGDGGPQHLSLGNNDCNSHPKGLRPLRRDATPLGLLSPWCSSTQGSRYASRRCNPGLEIAAPLGLKIRLKLLTVSSCPLVYPSVKKNSVISSLTGG